MRIFNKSAILHYAGRHAGARDDTEFRLLMLMVEKYEAGKYAVPPRDPVAAICFAVEQRGLARVLNGKAGISADMAVRLAAALGGSAESWLRMQANYDLWRA